MAKQRVSIGTYKEPYTSVKQVIDDCDGWDLLKAGAQVFIKPNIVFWTRSVPFPKWGVITTSRVVHDIVVLLKEHGIEDIVIGEGMVTMKPKDTVTPQHAYETLGYETLRKRYGVKYLNILERPFTQVNLGEGIELSFNTDALESDLIINVPVMKTHNQTVVSLGIKNLKGLIDIPSRKKCHSTDPSKDLHFHVARLADPMPPMLTVYDGIYTSERGPAFDGRLHRSNILMAATDVLAGDMVAASVLGHNPAEVPHLNFAAANHQRSTDLSDIDVIGTPVDDVRRFHAFDFEYTDETGGSLPVPLAKQGIRGVSYKKYDTSMCTYCSGVNGVVLSAIRYAWKGQPFDDVEVLTGKVMAPTPGHKKTILIGKCMHQANKDHPDINQMIAIKGCPPDPKKILSALHAAGIPADPGLFENMDQLPGFFMARYQDKPEFDESFFQISD